MTTQRAYWPTAGWRESTPEAQGMDSARLAEADAQIRTRYPYIQSLLVFRHGDLVFEQYYGGQDADVNWGAAEGEPFLSAPYTTGHSKDELKCLKSCTKSVLSALVGIALERGDLEGIDRPLDAFLPNYFTPDVDPNMRKITLRHLLKMRSSLNWEEGSIEQTISYLKARDLVRWTLTELRLLAEPGAIWRYRSPDSHLLGAALTESAGTSLLDYADRHLFRPMGITQRRWLVMAEGYYLGAGELYLTPRDMAKFGYLYLNGGQWDGQQLVPAAWAAESTANQEGVNGQVIAATMLLPEGETLPPGIERYRDGYGYQWWRGTFAGYPLYYAAGFGGQYIFVSHDLDLVTVMTGDTYMQLEAYDPLRVVSPYKILEEYVIPACGAPA